MSTYDIWICFHSLVYREGYREQLDSQITCSTLEVIPTVVLCLLTLLSRYTLLSVSQSINTAFPMKLSKGFNAS